MSPEEKDIEQYNQENFNVEHEDDPFYFWANTKVFLLLPLLLEMFYAHQLQQLPLKECFQPAASQPVANVIDLMTIT